MKAMLINTYGENAVFEKQEIATPSLKSGEVLIKIAIYPYHQTPLQY